MASSRPTSSASSRADAGSVARAFSTQRAALSHYVTRILDGDSPAAEAALQAANEALLASPSDRSLSPTELCFAACHREAHAAARLVDRAGRFVEPAARSAQGSHADSAMLRHIDRLTPKQQEVLRLKFQHGFDHAAIARISDLPEEKILGLIHTAVARLRAEFPSQTPVDDPRATASALDEHTNAERIAYAAILRENLNLRTGVAEIRAFAQQVQEALELEAGSRVSKDARDAAGSAKRKISRRPLFWFGLSGALAAAAGTLFYLRAPRSSSDLVKSPTADFSLKPAAWHNPAAEADKKNTAFRPDISAGERAALVEKDSPEHPEPRGRNRPSRIGNASAAANPITAEKPSSSAANLGAPDPAAALGQTPPSSEPPIASALKINSSRTTSLDKNPPRSSPDAAPLSEDFPDRAVTENSNGRGTSPRRTVHAAEKGRGANGSLDSKTPRENPVSALSTDAEIATVENLLRKLSTGELPKPADVNIGAMLNFFPTSDVAPQAPETFSATLESSEAPWNPQRRLVRIALKGREAPSARRARANLVFLIDISASMDLPERLPLVQEGLRLLLLRLNPDDRVAIVTYAGESKLLLPSTPVGDSTRIRQVLRTLQPAGQTNGGVGIQLAYMIAKGSFVEGGANRVILCTDGDFNLGTTSSETLTAVAAEQAKAGVSLSVFGFGRGYQIDARLEALAAQGRGHSGYINSRHEAERALAGEIEGLFAPIARDLKLDVTFNPSRVARYRLIGYEDHELSSSTVPSRSAETSLVGSGQTLTALYEIIPIQARLGEGAKAEPWLTFRVDYQSPTSANRERLEFSSAQFGTSFERASTDLKFAAAVAGFGMVLSGSSQTGDSTLSNVISWAEAGRGRDPGGYRGEFIELVRAARTLAPTKPVAETTR